MATPTNHIQYAEIGQDDRIYCHWKGRLAYLSVTHMETFCYAGCPYFNGTVQGDGIECKYDDGTGDPLFMSQADGAEELAKVSLPHFKPDPILPKDPEAVDDGDPPEAD